jgi:hypothetical protein
LARRKDDHCHVLDTHGDLNQHALAASVDFSRRRVRSRGVISIREAAMGVFDHSTLGVATGETSTRGLSALEVFVGRSVFLDTIDWGDVVISDGSGLGGSTFTNAGWGEDVIYVGRHEYLALPHGTLIHELVHVWQGENDGITGLAYKLNSLVHQGYHTVAGHGRNAAYTYHRSDLGKRGWDAFSTEEQAQIVQDWFVRGKKRTDPAYPYIYWCIQRLRWIGRPLGAFAPPPV